MHHPFHTVLCILCERDLTTTGADSLCFCFQMWCPPTPPHDENDVYIDQTLCFLYEPSVMPESHLPPVYMKREHKRIRVDPVLGKYCPCTLTREF